MKKISKALVGIITLSSGLMLTSCDFNMDEVKESINETLEYTLTVNFLDETTKIKFKTGEEINLNKFIPQIDGYEFKGWYYDSLFSIMVTESSFLNKDVEVYAKMVKIENTENQGNNNNSTESNTPGGDESNITVPSNPSDENEIVTPPSSENNQDENHGGTSSGSSSNENVSSGSSNSNSEGTNLGDSSNENHGGTSNGSSSSGKNTGSSNSNSEGENVSNRDTYYQSVTTNSHFDSFKTESVYDNLSKDAGLKGSRYEVENEVGVSYPVISYGESGEDQNNKNFSIYSYILFNNNEDLNSKLSASAVKSGSSLQSQFMEESNLTGTLQYKIHYYDYNEEKYIDKVYTKTIKGSLTNIRYTTESVYSKETQISISVDEEDFKLAFIFSIKEEGTVAHRDTSRFILQGEGTGTTKGSTNISINEENFLYSYSSETEGTTKEFWKLIETSYSTETIGLDINGSSTIEVVQK